MFIERLLLIVDYMIVQEIKNFVIYKFTMHLTNNHLLDNIRSNYNYITNIMID